MGCCVAAASCLLLLSLVSAARAEWLRVEREQGAEQCPDTAQLQARVEAVRAQSHASALPASEGYLVAFGRENDTWVARVRSGDSASHVRTLTAHAPQCESLVAAVVVALVLLLDAEPPPAAAPAPSAPPVAPPPRDAERPLPAGSEPTLRASLSLGAGPLLGVTRTIAPALEGDVGLWHKHFRATLGVLGVPIHREAFGPGSLRSWQLAGSAKGCATPYTNDRARIDLCSGVYAGVLDVRARGYTRNDQRKQPWVAIPLELAFHYRVGPVALGLSAAALFPVKRPEFSIDGLGSAFDPWPVSALISARVLAALPALSAHAQKK